MDIEDLDPVQIKKKIKECRESIKIVENNIKLLMNRRVELINIKAGLISLNYDKNSQSVLAVENRIIQNKQLAEDEFRNLNSWHNELKYFTNLAELLSRV